MQSGIFQTANSLKYVLIMVGRYPHTLTYETADSGGEYDLETGEYTPVVPGEQMLVACRATPQSEGSTKLGKGGAIQEYSYDLAFPKGIEPIPENTIVSIYGINDELLYKGEMIQFQEGVYSVRGWV